MRTKVVAAIMVVLSAGSVARSEPAECVRLKTSNEPFQLIRVINGGMDADYTSVFRQPDGRSAIESTPVGGGTAVKATFQGLFVIEEFAGKATDPPTRYAYAGVDPANFSLDRPTSYIATQTAPNGQTVGFKVEYAFLGRNTIALGDCAIDVVRYRSRLSYVANGQEVSFLEGEYSPDLQMALSSKGRLSANGKAARISIVPRKLNIGVDHFDAPSGPAPSKPTAGDVPPPEFTMAMTWRYRREAVPERILARGQTALVDKSGLRLGAVEFFCANPLPYIGIVVNKPGGGPAEHFWGEATRKTTLRLDGFAVPASVVTGIIYVDVGNEVRPILEKTFGPAPGSAPERRNIEVADFARFDLVVDASPASPALAGADLVSYDRMVMMCDAAIAGHGASRP
jgi:hypothetical protein